MSFISGYAHANQKSKKEIKQQKQVLSLLLHIGPPIYVISTWFDSSRIPTPSKPTILLNDMKYLPTTNRRKIFVQFEPEIIYKFRSFLLTNCSYYDYILTFDEVLLAKCPNARRYICAACWVPMNDISALDITQKTFKLSGIFTHLTYGVGHIFRRIIFARQKEITMPRQFYRSGIRGNMPEVENNPIFPSKVSKVELFRDCQFSLAIENSEQTNYFTEKIIDCLVTKTIPIYWGCPNIHDYFDTTGWILLRQPSFEELQEKLETLTPTYYQHYADAIEKNYKVALYYSNYYENLKRGLLSIPDY